MLSDQHPTRERIRTALLAVLDGYAHVFCEESGKCLRMAREVIQLALDIDYDKFYRRYRTHVVDDNPDPIANKWARDVMKSLTEQGRRVAFDENNPVIYGELEPGDILCSWALGSPIGHIAVLLTGGVNALAFENTGQRRGVAVGGYNRLTRVADLTLLYPGSWEAFRLPDPEPQGEVIVPLELPEPPDLLGGGL